MPLLNWLAVVAAIAVVLLTAAFRAPVPEPVPEVVRTGTETLEVVQSPNAQRVGTTAEEAPATTEKVDPTPIGADATTNPIVVSLPPVIVPAFILPPAPLFTQNDLERASEKIRAAVVNILCYADPGSVTPISGTGVVVDSRGLILTVAHVAQYFLLRDYPEKDDVECVIRIGSPARTAYKAELAYISKSWVRINPRTLLESEPSGTGENDFALLAITKSATSAPLPDSFPSVPLSEDSPDIGDATVIGSYGAQFLSGAEVQSSLYPILVFGSVQGLFTFRDNTVDLISLGGTVAAQEGSSGGGAVNAKAELIGLITTSSMEDQTASRDLRAITPPHIRASYHADTGNDFDSYFGTNALPPLVAAFASDAAALTAILVQNLGQ